MKLFKHQQEAVDFAISKNGRAAIFHEMGLGKTRTAIEIYTRLRQRTPNLKMLVVAPLSLLDAAWGNDLAKFSSYSYQNLHEDETFSEKFDVYVINYEKLQSEKRVESIAKFAANHPVLCVLDESSRLKNFKSLTAKTLLKLRDKFAFRIIMSGTPAPNCETEYWAQMQFVSAGIFSDSFYAFRNTWFHLEKQGVKLITQGSFMSKQAAARIFKEGYKYEMTPANREKLMKTISSWCHWGKKADCLDLPERIDEIRTVELGSKQRKVYNDLKRHMITEIQGSEITAQAALTKLMKLREVTSGFAFNEQGEALEIGESPKIDELIEVVQESGNQQIIIWANFHWEIRKIWEALSSYGQVVTLYSETESRNESVRDFLDGRARFLVAHPRSAAHGLTLVNCCLQVFFSLDYSLESYEQARARTHRAGQVNTCVYVHLIAKDSIDEEILEILKKKANAQELIYKIFKQTAPLQKVG